MIDYEISDLEEIWREGDKEMPDRVKRIINAAEEEILLRSLKLSTDAENTVKYNAGKSNKTVNEYISSLVMTSIQSV